TAALGTVVPAMDGRAGHGGALVSRLGAGGAAGVDFRAGCAGGGEGFREADRGDGGGVGGVRLRPGLYTPGTTVRDDLRLVSLDWKWRLGHEQAIGGRELTPLFRCGGGEVGGLCGGDAAIRGTDG